MTDFSEIQDKEDELLDKVGEQIFLKIRHIEPQWVRNVEWSDMTDVEKDAFTTIAESTLLFAKDAVMDFYKLRELSPQ